MKNTNDRIPQLRRSLARAVGERIEECLSLEEIYLRPFESPIEEMFLLGFATAATQERYGVSFYPRDAERVEYSLTTHDAPVSGTYCERPIDFAEHPGSSIGAPNAGFERQTRVFTQVAYKSYRLDLLIELPEYKYRVAVECDGHDFHERTKEQARRDRKRDRAMTTDGLAFLRFTGSEIYGDAIACGRDVLRYFDECEDRLRYGANR